MSLIVHQLKTDWRHFRGGLLALWGLFAVQLILAGPSIDPDAGSGLQSFLLFFQIMTGAFLLARIIQADSLVGSAAQWLTRPMRRHHLFWAKTTFILLCIVLPRLAPQLIICSWHHYSFSLFLDSIAEDLMFSLAVVMFFMTLAALTPGLPRFFLVLGVVLGGFFAWIALLSFFTRHAPHDSASLSASATTAGFLLFSGCAVLIWIWQVFTSRWVSGLVALGISLLALPGVIHAWSWDFLTPRMRPLPPLAISSLNDPNSLNDPADGQSLWSQFLITGLPPHHLVVVANTSANFTPDGQNRSFHLPSFREGNFNKALPLDSPQQANYLAIIHGFFPAETLWAGRQIYYWDGFPNTADILKKSTNRPLMGNFSCSVQLDQFNVRPAIKIPLRPGAWTLAPGKRLVIHELSPQQDGVQVEFEEIFATPMFSRSEYQTAPLTGMSHSYFTYVLYHPDWGEADVLENSSYSSAMPDVLNGESRQVSRYLLRYPVLQERLNGISRQEFLDKACLYVFVPEYEGTIGQSIVQTNFNLSAVHSTAPDYSDDQKDLEVIEQAVLPPQPTAAQRTDYLDTILGHLPENSGEPRHGKILAKLRAIGTPGIPLLLARLPLDARAEYDYVFPLLTKLATREQLPELREALGRDLQLADWFHDMKWDDDARDIVVSKLGDHRLHFSAVALGLAADAKDPTAYPDLTWHFVRLDNRQSQVADDLAKCPGFDLPGAVREAWERVQLDLNQPGDLALLAAKQGLPDALNQAVIRLEQSNDSPIHRQYQARQITALTDFSGPPDTAQNWLSVNLGRFNYDSVSHRYQLAAQADTP